MDRPTAAWEIESGQAAAGRQRIWWDHLYPLYSYDGVPRGQLSCGRAWPALSRYILTLSNSGTISAGIVEWMVLQISKA